MRHKFFISAVSIIIGLCGLMSAGGCNETFRQTFVPQLYEGLDVGADQLLTDSCDSLNEVVDGLLYSLARTAYPEGSFTQRSSSAGDSGSE